MISALEAAVVITDYVNIGIQTLLSFYLLASALKNTIGKLKNRFFDNSKKATQTMDMVETKSYGHASNKVYPFKENMNHLNDDYE